MTQAVAAPDHEHDGGPMGRVKELMAKLKASRPYRVFSRFTLRRGNLLSAGMSYQALFAIFAALWLGFAVAGIWLASDRALMDSVIATINQAAPGLVGEGGAVSRDALAGIGGTLGWTGIIAAVGLLGTAMGWLAATREAVRTMFDVGQPQKNAVLQKLRDLGLGLGFGVLLLVAAVVSLGTTAVLSGLYELLGIGERTFWAQALTQAASFVVTTIINTAVLAGMYRVLSELKIPLRGLLVGSLIGAIALTIMSSLSGLLLGGAHKNPLAASFAVILGLLIWFNLVCRVLLLCASWIAVGMADRGEAAEALTPEQAAKARRARELDARIVLAEGELHEREDAAESARGFGRRRAQRKAQHIRRHLAALRQERGEQGE